MASCTDADFAARQFTREARSPRRYTLSSLWQLANLPLAEPVGLRATRDALRRRDGQPCPSTRRCRASDGFWSTVSRKRGSLHEFGLDAEVCGLPRSMKTGPSLAGSDRCREQPKPPSLNATKAKRRPWPSLSKRDLMAPDIVSIASPAPDDVRLGLTRCILHGRMGWIQLSEASCPCDPSVAEASGPSRVRALKHMLLPQGSSSPYVGGFLLRRARFADF